MTKNTVAIKKGDRLAFKGYTDLEEGMDALFEEGDILIAAEVTKDKNGDVKVKAYKEGGDKDEIDTLFYPDEVDLASDDAEEEAEETDEVEADEEEADEAEADEAEEEVEEVKPAKTKAKAVAKTKEEAPAKAKAKPAPAPARTQEEDEQAEIHHMKSVAKIIKKAESGDGILEAAKSLATQVEQTYFNLGGVLAEIHSKRSYVEAGFKGDTGWEKYLADELNLDYRKAMYLIEIYKTFSKIGIDETRIAEIGWTKMRSVAKVAKGLDAKQLDKLLEKASKMKRDDLDAYIVKNFVGSKGASERIAKVVYKFTAMGDEAEYINASVARAQELVEGGDVNSALKHIVREWAMMADGVELKLQDAMKAVETRFGVKLAVAADTEAEVEEEAEADEEVAPVKSKKAAPAKKSAAKKVTSSPRSAKKTAANSK